MAKRKKSCKGNFVRPTPAAAKKYIASWERKKDADGNKIVVPEQITLKTEKATRLARIRLAEAQKVMEDFYFRCMKHDQFLKSRKDIAKGNKKKLAELKQQFDGFITAPGKKCSCKNPNVGPPPSCKRCLGMGYLPTTSKAKNRCKAGNFRPMSVSGARAYLKRLFRLTNKELSELDFSKQLKSVFYAKDSAKIQAELKKRSKQTGVRKFSPGRGKKNIWNLDYRAYQHAPRVAEAVELVGEAEALAILKNAQMLKDLAEVKATAAAMVAAERQKIRDVKDKAKKQKLLEKLEKFLAKKKAEVKDLQKQIRELKAAASRFRKSRRMRMARAKKAMKRARKSRMRKRKMLRKRRKNPCGTKEKPKRKRKLKRRKRKNPNKDEQACCRRKRKKRRKRKNPEEEKQTCRKRKSKRRKRRKTKR